MNNSIDLISPQKASKRLSIPISTLYRWINEGRFPKPIKIGPRRTAFRLCDIENWIQQQIKSQSVDKGK